MRMTERRRRERLDLKLPIRLRWHGPLVPLLEASETVDVSRAGLLICRQEPCRVKAPLWVRFPFHAEARVTQPETLARVAHVKALAACGYLVGLAYEESEDGSPSAHSPVRTAALGFAPDKPERRSSTRVCLGLPVRARKADTRWPEETVTTDVSEMGVRFHSARFYALGDPVRVALTYLYDSWESAEELFGHVVRVEPLPDSTLDSVAVRLATSVPANVG